LFEAYIILKEGDIPTICSWTLIILEKEDYQETLPNGREMMAIVEQAYSSL
jgi:hypothetical protein